MDINEVGSFVLSVSLRSLALFAVAGVFRLGLRRASAASRHLLWVMTLAGLLCLPLLSIWLPPVAAPILPAAVLHPDDNSAPALAAPAGTVPDFPKTSSLPGPASGSRHRDFMPLLLVPSYDSLPGTSRPDSGKWLGIVWLTGVGIVLLRICVGLLGAARLVRRSCPITAVSVLQARQEARQKLGLRGLPSIRSGRPGTPITVPMTFGGGWRHIILLPHGAETWPADRLQVVLMHEMAHIRRLDWVTTMLAQVVCALYWFHPLVWCAARSLRTEAEVACDDLVVTYGVAAPDYAEHLLDVVRGLEGRRVTAAVVTMACRREVNMRLRTILAERRNRGRVTGRALVLAVFAALGLAVPLAAVYPVAADVVPRSAGKTRWFWEQSVQAQKALDAAQTSLNGQTLSSSPVWSLETVPGDHTDARSVALLQKVQAATRAAHSLEANLTYTVQYPGEAAQGIAGQVPVKLMKPNSAAVFLTESKWSPLADLTRSNPPTTSHPAPDGGDIRVWDSIVVQAFFDSSKAVKSWIYVGNLGDLTYAGTETVTGTQYQVLKHRMMGTLRGKPCPFLQRLYIGPDNLIHRYRLDFKYNGQPGIQIADLHNIRLNVPFPKTDFEFDAAPETAGEPSGARASRDAAP